VTRVRYAFPATIVAEPGGSFSVTFRDVPEAHATGRTRAVAIRRAEAALISALSFYADAGEPLPRPGPARGRTLIVPGAAQVAKLALNDQMARKRISNLSLARKLGCDEKAVRRLRDLLHRSRMPELERALAAVGLMVVVEVRDAA
jgi:antitoxin HicB